ncbi:uncharacterized protein MYCFIDRAFT_173354 [Pseudocercospora fijiensis CIRAD86]|uniref:Uncharacterized protein n=1 Tax=Pseudocercospora fijiensis (strain CIRAD86) TaxID=383855 RepID=M3B4R9_PSEFD|nr:uncharacterized protein MYCFIDRAFT_173354 [Pseudocercospora fijiensis CIRAD86]EME84347.1 hypothetical protein MYCFIDRAFT_173354 [Pseudocercospora fijiensis CIRAD86]
MPTDEDALVSGSGARHPTSPTQVGKVNLASSTGVRQQPAQAPGPRITRSPLPRAPATRPSPSNTGSDFRIPATTTDRATTSILLLAMKPKSKRITTYSLVTTLLLHVILLLTPSSEVAVLLAVETARNLIQADSILVYLLGLGRVAGARGSGEGITQRPLELSRVWQARIRTRTRIRIRRAADVWHYLYQPCELRRYPLPLPPTTHHLRPLPAALTRLIAAVHIRAEPTDNAPPCCRPISRLHHFHVPPHTADISPYISRPLHHAAAPPLALALSLDARRTSIGAPQSRTATPKQPVGSGGGPLKSAKLRGSSDKENGGGHGSGNGNGNRSGSGIRRTSSANVLAAREKIPSKDGTVQRNAKDVEGLKDYVRAIPLLSHIHPLRRTDHGPLHFM